MNDDTKDPKGPNDPPKLLSIPPGPEWKQWFTHLRVAVDDHDAVTRDLLRKKRNRDLGVREQKRLYREARDRFRELFALLGSGGEGDESGGDPAGSGGSPAD